MLALIVLLLILAIFGVGIVTAHPLLFIAAALLILWLGGWFVGGPVGSGRGYWSRR